MTDSKGQPREFRIKLRNLTKLKQKFLTKYTRKH